MHYRGDEPAGLHIWRGEAIPLRVDAVGREGPCPKPHLQTSLCFFLAEGHHKHLLGPTAPGTALGLTCIAGCDNLKTLVPCQQNWKILVCMKGNKAPITVHRIAIIHPIFFQTVSTVIMVVPADCRSTCANS